MIEVLREQDNAPRLVVYGHDARDLPRLAMTAGAAGFASRAGDVDSYSHVVLKLRQVKWFFHLLMYGSCKAIQFTAFLVKNV